MTYLKLKGEYSTDSRLLKLVSALVTAPRRRKHKYVLFMSWLRFRHVDEAELEIGRDLHHPSSSRDATLLSAGHSEHCLWRQLGGMRVDRSLSVECSCSPALSPA